MKICAVVRRHFEDGSRVDNIYTEHRGMFNMVAAVMEEDGSEWALAYRFKTREAGNENYKFFIAHEGIRLDMSNRGPEYEDWMQLVLGAIHNGVEVI